MAVSTQRLGTAFAGTMYSDNGVTSTAINASSAAGSLYMVQVVNGTAAIAYLKIWDDATVTVGTDAPQHIISCPANSTFSVCWPQGLAHTAALTYACVTSALDTGATSPTGGTVTCTILYA